MAVTLRLWLPASTIGGVALEVAYPVVAWPCWLPHLGVAELLLLRGRRRVAGAPAGAGLAP